MRASETAAGACRRGKWYDSPYESTNPQTQNGPSVPSLREGNTCAFTERGELRLPEVWPNRDRQTTDNPDWRPGSLIP